MTLSRAERERLIDDVWGELIAGNWPTCQSCESDGGLVFIGLVADTPTFACRCGTFFAMDLRDA